MTDSSAKLTEDAALVQIGRACVEPEPDGTENTRSTKIASNPSLTPSRRMATGQPDSYGPFGPSFGGICPRRPAAVRPGEGCLSPAS